MNSGANDETAAAEDLDLTMLLSYPALFSVMLHRIMTFVPVKHYTQTVYSYNKWGRITLQCCRDRLHYSVAARITLYSVAGLHSEVVPVVGLHYEF